MSEENNLPNSNQIESAENQTFPEAESSTDEMLGERLQYLTAEYARERAQLAEKISQLLEENDQLKQSLRNNGYPVGAQQPVCQQRSSLECELGLDFALPEHQAK